MSPLFFTSPSALADATLALLPALHLDRLAIPFALLLVLLAIEYRLPFAPPPREQAARRAANLGLGVLYRLIASPLLIGPLAAMAFAEGSWRAAGPDWCRSAPMMALDFALLDLLNYAMHVLAHHVPLLWRFHAVHHLDIHLDVTTGLRQHFGEKVLLQAVRLPALVLLGVPALTIAVFDVAALCFGVFHHANVRLPRSMERIAGALIVMPSFHRVHHGRAREHTDSNYGFILSIWDRLFRTVSAESTAALKGFTQGLDHHGPLRLRRLLALPFSSLPIKRWS